MRNPRYVPARKVHTDTILQLQPEGQCQWCGKDLVGKQKWWCCAKHRRLFREFWLRIPKYKRAVFLHDQFICQICGAEHTKLNEYGITIPDLSRLSVDHKIPISKGGTNEPGNLQTACRTCNSVKGDKILW